MFLANKFCERCFKKRTILERFTEIDKELCEECSYLEINEVRDRLHNECTVKYSSSDKSDDIDVSVIIPVFNAASSIESLVKKIFQEQRINIEVIVINDGSTDGTSSVLDSIEDDRLVVINQENIGVYSARNAGLEYHRGTWLIFLDADDDVTEGFIFDRYNLAVSQDVDVLVVNAWRNWTGDNKLVPVHSKQPYDQSISGLFWIRHCVMNKEWPHYLWLQMVRSGYIKKNNIKFHAGKSHKDILWTIELALKGARFYISKKQDYTYIYNTKSITNRDDYYDVRAENYIDVINKIISYSREENNRPVKLFLLRHALVETRHFLGLYRKKVNNKQRIKTIFRENVSFKELFKGIDSASDVFFCIKLGLKFI